MAAIVGAGFMAMLGLLCGFGMPAVTLLILGRVRPAWFFTKQSRARVLWRLGLLALVMICIAPPSVYLGRSLGPFVVGILLSFGVSAIGLVIVGLIRPTWLFPEPFKATKENFVKMFHRAMTVPVVIFLFFLAFVSYEVSTMSFPF